ncbi:GDP-L-fucose synthase [Cyclobacteriaceae bacterium]|nr:GDP-L-fucose synthase [Cyclobacteriaceae bacterium]MDB4605783.1 GDP-L-fucose synthase [Cyclobacteriaceae bacterium]|tara:strand:+ start:775 stop:1707 length:933 start_codon:yes stop_codon:yes gene_type:complete
MEQSSKIYIAGHRGMVGSSLERKLRKEGYNNIVIRSSSELDLRNQKAVNDFFEKEKPEYVVLAAAKVGGIHANNTYRAEFIYDNLMIEVNIIHAAYLNKVTKLLFLGSSCIYPRMAPQPLKEEYLLSGYLEPTNQPYAIAKIAGIELCQSYRAQYGCNFISAMPTNLYGTNDNYHTENSHVLPALLKKIVLAHENNEPNISIWGTGTPRREFLHVYDLADACYFLLKNYNEQALVNIGCGIDVSIKELAEIICFIVGYKGALVFDSSKPDGVMRKLMSSEKINEMGWKPSINLEEGIKKSIEEFKSKHKV